MKLASYAWNHADVILWCVLKHTEPGFSVNNSANDQIDGNLMSLDWGLYSLPGAFLIELLN